MLRLLHLLVLATLIFAAADVYKIKFDSTRQAERLAKLRQEIRRERDSIASLRAEWTELDRPDRIQDLAKRHLTLKPVDVYQFDSLDKLPERPPQIVPPGTADPIGAIIETYADAEILTGSLPDQKNRR
jgi:cell division protein FtsL